MHSSPMSEPGAGLAPAPEDALEDALARAVVSHLRVVLTPLVAQLGERDGPAPSRLLGLISTQVGHGLAVLADLGTPGIDRRRLPEPQGMFGQSMTGGYFQDAETFGAQAIKQLAAAAGAGSGGKEIQALTDALIRAKGAGEDGLAGKIQQRLDDLLPGSAPADGPPSGSPGDVVSEGGVS